MARQNEFVDYLLDMLQTWGGVRARAMFGGFGLYKDDIIFGIVADDTLYIKADDNNRARFLAQQLTPFTYTTSNKTATMSYYQSPADALEDSQTLTQWVNLGYEAGLRADTLKKAKKKRHE